MKESLNVFGLLGKCECLLTDGGGARYVLPLETFTFFFGTSLSYRVGALLTIFVESSPLLQSSGSCIEEGKGLVVSFQGVKSRMRLYT